MEIIYTGVKQEFTREELRIISSLSAEKHLMDKIMDRLTYKLQIDMLNEQITPEEVKGFKKACSAFLSTFKRDKETEII